MIDLRVFGRIQQRHVGMLRADTAQVFDGGIGVKFGNVPGLEFREFRGSWPNHLRSEGEGETAFSHRSRAARSFVMPRGHRRSTSTRNPSDAAGSSYMRLIAIPIYSMIGACS